MTTRFLVAGATGAAMAFGTLMTGTLVFGALVFGTHPSYAQNAPHYEADLAWPKPLPDHWIMGGLGGLCVDANDHVLILNRQDVLPNELDTGTLAPPLIEFDPAGNVVHSWGDPKLLDARLHSCHFDKDNNVWIAAAPSGMVQKYTHDGSKLLAADRHQGRATIPPTAPSRARRSIPTPPASTCRRASSSTAATATSTSPTARAQTATAASR